MIHQLQQLFAFVDHGNPLPPRQGSCKKSGNLNVLLFLKLMWNRNRIQFNEVGCIIQDLLSHQEILSTQVQTSSASPSSLIQKP